MINLELIDEQAIAVRNAIYELDEARCLKAEYQAARQALNKLNELVFNKPVYITEVVFSWAVKERQL